MTPPNFTPRLPPGVARWLGGYDSEHVAGVHINLMLQAHVFGSSG
jgi:hypothetical protein